MTKFISYYWSPNLLKETKLLSSVQCLVKGNNLSADQVEAFKRLVGSDDVVAQGIAFDHFFYAESLLRHGLYNPFLQFKDELLAKSRNQLKCPPLNSYAPDGKLIIGANHASALGVIAHLGDQEDIERIASILEISDDQNVIFAACLAAQLCLSKTSEYHATMVDSLSKIIFDKKWPDNTRVTAVRAFSEYGCLEIEDLLAKISQETNLPISAHAAYILSYKNIALYRDLLREISDHWPLDARYPANEVRNLISKRNLD